MRRRLLPLLVPFAPVVALFATDLALALRPFPPVPEGAGEWLVLAGVLLGLAWPVGVALAALLGAGLAACRPARRAPADPARSAAWVAGGVALLAGGALLLPVARWFFAHTHDHELAAAGLVVVTGGVAALGIWLAVALGPVAARRLPGRLLEPVPALLLAAGLPAAGVGVLALSPWVGADRAPWSLLIGPAAAVLAWAAAQRRAAGAPPRLAAWGSMAAAAVVALAVGLALAAAWPRVARAVLDKTRVGAALLAVAGDVLDARPPPPSSAEPPPGAWPAPRPAPDRRPAEPPNVLLITVDALRWDHTTLAGYGRPTTPRLGELAREAVVFERAYSPASTTRFSVPAILAGRPPSKVLWRRKGRDLYVRPRGTPLLPAVLRAHGVQTAAVLNNYNIFLPSFGLAEGFQVYDTRSVRYVSSRVIRGGTAGDSTDAALRVLSRLRPPWFLWLHYMDPHAPYDPGEGAPDFGETDLDRYDAEVAMTDRALGRLLDLVRARDDADRTVVVVTSDHGEQFSERGRKGHGLFVTDEEVRVPLVLRLPGVGPGRVRAPVCVSDVTPTVLDLYGLLEEVPGLEGRNLLRLLDDPDPRTVAPAVVETWPFSDHRSRRLALMEGTRKVRHSVRDGSWWFHDLAEDPGERRRAKTAAFPAAEQDRLRGLLEQFLTTHALPTW